MVKIRCGLCEHSGRVQYNLVNLNLTNPAYIAVQFIYKLHITKQNYSLTYPLTSNLFDCVKCGI
jgi:hypothetical protein